MAGESLRRRLAVGWLIGLALTLSASGVLLVLLFRDHIERRFDHALNDHLVELVAAAEPQDGRFALTWTPADPRFNRPLSGWYWEVRDQDRVTLASTSLAGAELSPPVLGVHRLVGPEQAELRALARSIRFADDAADYTVRVAGPAADIAADVRGFALRLAVTLIGLAVGLSAILAWQLHFGLAPLRRLQTTLAEVRTGRSHRLPETFPEEVAGVVHELNGLIDHNAALIERARAQTGNLAHALKTPLAVAIGEARHAPGEAGELIRRRLAGMAEALEMQLARARLAGAGRRLGVRVTVQPVVTDVLEAMIRLHPARRFTAEGLDGLVFQGDGQDLEEMLGNLLDNAGKWARSRVRIAGRRSADRLHLTVEDDGAGIPPERRAEALGRGRRLDETVPGSGLGLAIVAELAELCGGRLSLNDSAWGGLAADLDLPSGEG